MNIISRIISNQWEKKEIFIANFRDYITTDPADTERVIRNIVNNFTPVNLTNKRNKFLKNYKPLKLTQEEIYNLHNSIFIY